MTWRELMGVADLEKHPQYPQNPTLKGREPNIADIADGIPASRSRRPGAATESRTPTRSSREENETNRLVLADGWRLPRETPPAVAAEISRIEDEARRLGWSHERLWNADFWPHSREHPRGLASVLDPSDRIGAVTEGFIEILQVRSVVLRFPRSEA